MGSVCFEVFAVRRVVPKDVALSVMSFASVFLLFVFKLNVKIAF